MKFIISLIATALTLASTDVMSFTNLEYTKICFASSYANDWVTASMFCGSGATNAEREGADPKTIAAFWREHARASGAMCSFSRARIALEKSLALDTSSNGPVNVDYIELARLHFKQKLFKEASKYFQAGIAATPKEVISQDPIGYAEVLHEYSEALRQIGDVAGSESIIAETKQLHSSNPNSKSLTKLTPYGEFCDHKS